MSDQRLRHITVRGARTHNLKAIDVDIPRDKVTVITGLSGSGKSSLAFDTIYAEGQRRYVESLSAYARQFLSLMEKPDVDLIEGLSPAISIEQKATSHNPRSTVGTVTEIYDYMRLLYARAGEPRCPEHQVTLEAQTVSQMVDMTLELPEGTRVMLLAPVIQDRKGEYQKLLGELHAQGYLRARIDGEVVDLDEPPELAKTKRHTIEAVIDRIIIREGNEQRLAESFETALALADGAAIVAALPREDEEDTTPEMTFSSKFACPHCGYSLASIEPRMFSFNNPAGACQTCDGLGAKQFFDPDRVVRDASLTLSAGAISGWDQRTTYYYSTLVQLAAHYDVDIDQPFEDLPASFAKKVLYGSGKEKIEFTYERGEKNTWTRTQTFEGVIPTLERRYRETESQNVREEMTKYIGVAHCDDCNAARLRVEARNVFIADEPINTVTALPIGRTLEFFKNLKLEGRRATIAERIVNEIEQRLTFLVDVGLNYLSLDRSADTLSGGESQRIRLASQIGSGLVGVTYILDEPSIGLHQRDNGRLLDTLFRLRELGNTIVVVEHDEDAIRSADYVIDIGPGAGVHGGEVIAAGTPDEVENCPDSITGKYLTGAESIAVPEKRLPFDKDKTLSVRGATGNNLKNVDVDIPLGVLTCVTGVSGSGKSTLINDTLYPAVASKINRSKRDVAAHKSIKGIEHIDRVIDIDQSPIGRTPRSNPATYAGLFTPMRELFASAPEARARGYKAGRFSFNVKGGRCEACQGDGLIKVEMHFLADVYVPCDVCHGARYNRETLEIRYKGKNIKQALDMTVEDAANFFSAIPVIKRKLDTLLEVGLGYIQIGQSATTLSGGEAQRIKLARELSKRDTGNTLYVLDEPTTGLHFHDVRQLLGVLTRLRDAGNTIVVIEHNLDIIKCADWLIDLGPEGGDGGGTILAAGRPEEVAKTKGSFTGEFLAKML